MSISFKALTAGLSMYLTLPGGHSGNSVRGYGSAYSPTPSSLPVSGLQSWQGVFCEDAMVRGVGATMHLLEHLREDQTLDWTHSAEQEASGRPRGVTSVCVWAVKLGQSLN